jgi:hypothetical protein
VSPRATLVSRLAVTGDHPRYRRMPLSDATRGVLTATINSSFVIISLPDIFHGIKLDPPRPGKVGYPLWMLMGFLLFMQPSG